MYRGIKPGFNQQKSLVLSKQNLIPEATGHNT